MRGKATIQAINTASFRITPAYAGKSIGYICVFVRTEDHPRVCGEKERG